MGASEGIVNGSFLVFTFLFFAGLFVGRAFCGWACPAGGLQECCFRISDKKARGGRFNWIKYIFIGLPWFAIIIVMVVWSGGYRSVNMFYQMENIISVDQPFGFIGFYVFAGIILILALTAGKRGFYHYVCWITLFMIFGRKIRDIFKWPSLRLKADKDRCTNCKKCSRNCPMSLDVNSMVQEGAMENLECILCGSCIDGCPKSAIKFSFSRGI